MGDQSFVETDTEKQVAGTEDVPGSDMNDEGKMPMPKRPKRNNNKRED